MSKTEIRDLQISNIDLAPSLQKVVRKLQWMFNVKTTADVLSLEPNNVKEFRGVGRLYFKRLRELQDEIRKLLGLQTLQTPDVQETEIVAASGSQDWQKTTLNYGLLDSEQRKLIRKFQKLYQCEPTAGALMSLDAAEMAELPGVGRLTRRLLVALQKRISSEKSSISNYAAEWRKIGPEHGQSPPSAHLLVLDINGALPIDVIESMLIADFEQLLSTLDDTEREIALVRWGYTRTQLTLEELGERFNVTRERIRQHEKNINELIPHSFRISTASIRLAIEQAQAVTGSFLDSFSLLKELFSSSELILQFIERCCGYEAGQLHSELPLDKPQTLILEQLFSKTPAPVSVNICMSAFLAHGMSQKEANRYMRAILKNKLVSIENNVVTPHCLPKEAAIAHVLMSHPPGLPWLDILSIINKRTLTKSPLAKNRSFSVLSNSDLFYLCERGCYRHLRFLEVQNIDSASILTDVRHYLSSRKISGASLQAISFSIGCNLDYYVLRYIVDAYGEEEGLFFRGKSLSDTVSLTKDFVRGDIASTVLQILADASGALTIEEIAQRLRSKSSAMARIGVTRLRVAGDAVRVDEALYTTSTRAFADLDYEIMTTWIGDILAEDERPVEIDVIRERINDGYGLSRSRYFYLDFCKKLAALHGWHIRRTLIDKKPITLPGIYAVFRSAFSTDRSNDEVREIISRQVRLSRSFISGMLSSWVSLARQYPSRFMYEAEEIVEE